MKHSPHTQKKMPYVSVDTHLLGETRTQEMQGMVVYVCMYVCMYVCIHTHTYALVIPASGRWRQDIWTGLMEIQASLLHETPSHKQNVATKDIRKHPPESVGSVKVDLLPRLLSARKQNLPGL